MTGAERGEGAGSGTGGSSRGRTCIVGLVAAHVVALGVMLATLPDDIGGHFVAADAVRYTQIATDPGLPWIERQVEVPPLEVGYLTLMSSPDARTTAVRNAVAQLIVGLFIAWSVWLGWGRRSSASYLALSLPLAPFLAFRLDMLSVALAVLGLALVRRDAPRAGGLVIAAGVLAKLWPAVTATTLIAQRRWRALWWMTGASVGTLAAWTALTHGRGPSDVLSFRGAHAWQIESSIGALQLAFGDQPVIFQSGANRVGLTTATSTVAIAVVLGLLLALVSWLGRRAMDSTTDTSSLDALVTLAATCAVLVCAPILSWQYIAWLLPWLAIVLAHPSHPRDGTSARRIVAAAGCAVVLGTTWLVFLGVELTQRAPMALVALLLRNTALLLLLLGSTLLIQPAHPDSSGANSGKLHGCTQPPNHRGRRG